ncbi:Endoribonuclease L-PSP family protein [Ketogulonicigenium robustum]|uniref:Endoribonuclease L-PSP family protein n=1 Tax=Ketogulonicigenium robustum TaxID=92947 RepID=A0A1W6NXE1_9RHOB|nr:RidA family protein [Ketogulonicigenium robustum]ARO13677.1 Endoribonuclease L-PSP family protein [Ketogulonicigenium robustum]
MTHPIETRLADLGITLPEAPMPAANYVPYVVVGDMIHISGQISMADGALIKGRLGDDLDIPAGAAAARACGLNLLAQLKAACGGDLSRVKRVVKLGGFVNSAPAFTDQPEVINGASDLMVEVFGDAGRHARAAVGVAALPRGVAVEVEGLFQIA